jgi:hypothetical protein
MGAFAKKASGHKSNAIQKLSCVAIAVALRAASVGRGGTSDVCIPSDDHFMRDLD